VQAALSGYFTIAVVIGVGWLAAHTRILDEAGRRVLSRLAFTVASPVLLFTLVSTANLQHLFSGTLVVSALAIAVAALAYLLAARVLLGAGQLADRVVGTLCSSYTNAGNLGLPIAAYVLGDMTWMAPILLIQVAVLQPTALALLDASAARRAGRRLRPLTYVSLPFRNPITLGTLAGLAVNLLGWTVPPLVLQPLDMIAGIAVPSMLIALGVSLRLDPRPGRGPHARELVLTSIVKVLVHPALALGIGWCLGLGRPQLLAVTVLAALPTAQNVYLISGRYQVQHRLARDAVFVTTVASIPVIIAASTWLR
jgi:malonate transporter and related proteins